MIPMFLRGLRAMTASEHHKLSPLRLKEKNEGEVRRKT
jgi:hypothetical protein